MVLDTGSSRIGLCTLASQLSDAADASAHIGDWWWWWWCVGEGGVAGRRRMGSGRPADAAKVGDDVPREADSERMWGASLSSSEAASKVGEGEERECTRLGSGRGVFRREGAVWKGRCP